MRNFRPEKPYKLAWQDESWVELLIDWNILTKLLLKAFLNPQTHPKVKKFQIQKQVQSPLCIFRWIFSKMIKKKAWNPFKLSKSSIASSLSSADQLDHTETRLYRKNFSRKSKRKLSSDFPLKKSSQETHCRSIIFSEIHKISNSQN